MTDATRKALIDLKVKILATTREQLKNEREYVNVLQLQINDLRKQFYEGPINGETYDELQLAIYQLDSDIISAQAQAAKTQIRIDSLYYEIKTLLLSNALLSSIG